MKAVIEELSKENIALKKCTMDWSSERASDTGTERDREIIWKDIASQLANYEAGLIFQDEVLL